MKLTITLLLFVILTATAGSTYSQSTSITLKMQDASLVDVFREIERTSEFGFFFKSEEIDLNKRVSIDLKNVSIEEILKKILMDNYDYRILDKNIVVTRGNFSTTEVQQGKSVSGKVTDSSGASLPGVSVVLQGTTNGVITDNNGNYSLSNIPENATLQFSFVGMKGQEVVVGNMATINVILAEETIGIDEVVAIGYGTMKKSDLTGSVSTINNTELTQRAITQLGQGLQGKVAGVQITQPSGAPGKAPIVRIRGINSIQYGNDPLWVVDGFPVGSGISFVNPNDIETMTVLKDASATAIYGSRGANGVIIVTTKKGKSGRTNVTYESYYGAQNVTKTWDLMNAKQYATGQRLFWERFRNGSLIVRAFPQSEIDQMGEGTDWQDEVFRTGIIQSHNLSIMGGNDKTTFSVSGNYLNQEGIVINSKYTKGTVSINIEHRANDKFKFGTSLISAYEYNQSINDQGVVYGALIMAPTSPVKNEDGTYFSQFDYWAKTGIMSSIGLQNPVQTAYEQVSNSNSTHLLGNFFSSYEIIDGLTAKISVGAEINYRRSNAYTPSYFRSELAAKGSAQIYANQRFNWVNENTLTYIKSFNEVHSLTALFGLTAQRQETESVTASNTNFYTDITKYYNLGNGSLPGIPQSGYNRWSLASFLGRVSYDYKSKYLITVSARYDGSSRFGDNNRFGFFPSGALAWRVNQEEFLKDVAWLSNLKVRASYGKTGNQEIPLYQNVQTFNKITSYVIGNSSSTAVAPGALVNPDLKWETTSQYNAGIDVGFFDNKLNFTADYYNKRTDDLLFGVSVPRQGGYTTVLQNIGSVENKGFEFGVNANVNKGDFNWNASTNISFNKNKVLALANADFFFGPALGSVGSESVRTNGGAVTVIKVGEPIGVFWGNIFDGLWQTKEELDAGHMSANPNAHVGFENYRDIDGNGVFEEGKDETVVGNPHPDFEFGINNSFSYKYFDLSFSINGVVGNEVFNANMIVLTSQQNINNQYIGYVNAWNGPGTSDKYFINDRPAGRAGDFSNRVATQYIEDGSFVRLQNLTFGYTVPLRSIKKLRVYASADNLLTLSNYTGYNPEVSSMGNQSTAMGIDIGAYPAAKTFRLGVRVDF